MTLKKIFIVSFLTLSIIGCKRDPLKIDISKTSVAIQFTNLDSLLFNTPENELIPLRSQLSNSIPELFDYQIGYCLRIGRVSDTAFVNSILQYRADTSIQHLEKEIKQTFTHLTGYKENLILAFRHLKTHLPKSKLPSQIVFQNSLFNSSAFCTEKEIGIGLEQYLGKDSPFIKRLPSDPFYEWMKEGFDKQYIERDAVLSWVLTHTLPEIDGNLAEEIIYYGKALYITEATMPSIPKHIILRYSEKDLKWANDNEYSFWKYLVDEKMLFQTNEKNAQNMLSEGPFTAGLPEKGPIGWDSIWDGKSSKITWRIQKPHSKS